MGHICDFQGKPSSVEMRASLGFVVVVFCFAVLELGTQLVTRTRGGKIGIIQGASMKVCMSFLWVPNESSQPACLKTRQMHSLTAPQARSLKSRCPHGMLPVRALGEKDPCPVPNFQWPAPTLGVSCSWPHPCNLCCVLTWAFPAFLCVQISSHFSYKDTSHWVSPHPKRTMISNQDS